MPIVKKRELYLTIKPFKAHIYKAAVLQNRIPGRHSPSKRLGNAKEHEIWVIMETKGKCK